MLHTARFRLMQAWLFVRYRDADTRTLHLLIWLHERSIKAFELMAEAMRNAGTQADIAHRALLKMRSSR